MSRWWSIQSKKYSTNEIEYFVNEKENITLLIDTNWKWATVNVCSETEPTNAEKAIDLYTHFDEVEIDWLESGYSEFRFTNTSTGDDLNPDDFQELIDKYHEDGYDALWNAGYSDYMMDSELWMEGDFKVEPADDPYAIDVEVENG